MLYSMCHYFMNQLNINESDIPVYDKHVNFRQNKGVRWGSSVSTHWPAAYSLDKTWL